MTKRAVGQFSRRDRDFYPTPEKAVLPLLQHLSPQTRFYEPCAGNGSLSKILEKHGHLCMGQSDLFPQVASIRPQDARWLSYADFIGVDAIITNPPWTIPLLHQLILRLSVLRPTWLLIYSDWLFTQRAKPFLSYATKIVTIGRVRWIAGSAHDGFDNACWVCFESQPTLTTFIA